MPLRGDEHRREQAERKRALAEQREAEQTKPEPVEAEEESDDVLPIS